MMSEFRINITEEFCETNFPGAFDPFFRAVKVYQIILGIVSMISIAYFIKNYNSFLRFHFNIKILFYIQFSACFAQSAILVAFQTHHLITALLAEGPCDVILSPTLFGLFNIPMVFSMLCIEFSQILMVIERTLASCLFACYEKSTRGVGMFLSALAISIPSIMCIYMYHDDKFDYPQMSAMATSPGSLIKINYLFILVNVVNAIALFHSIGLYKHNQRRRNTISSRDSFHLTSRYQINENVTSSQLLWYISAAQLAIYLLYGFAMYAMRIFLTGPRSGAWQAVTELCYTPPLYCVIMPFLCIITIQKSQNERNRKISSLVQMRAKGAEGWDNYSNMLQKQWA